MIVISEKNKCCGCSACQSVCPRNSITMIEDAEGFLYPKVNMQTCIDCGLCEKVCPYLNIHEERTAGLTIGAINNNTFELESSTSGGAFSAIAKNVIERQGKVFGAGFNSDWVVCHTPIDSMEGLKQLRGSKYVQSKLGDIYKQIHGLLEQKTEVLFSGTPCQVNGLKNFLRRDYDNLICVEIVCHGVASPRVWNDYNEQLPKKKNIVGISFRDKRKGWAKYGFRVEYSDGSEIYENRDKNFYIRGYLTNTFLRPSCYNCPSKAGRSGADIAIGDFWGVKKYYPNLDVQSGVSLVLAYTNKGISLLKDIDINRLPSTYEQAVASNAMLLVSTDEPTDRELFWNEYKKNGLKAIYSALKRRRPSCIVRMKTGLIGYAKLSISLIKKIL